MQRENGNGVEKVKKERWEEEARLLHPAAEDLWGLGKEKGAEGDAGPSPRR